MNFVDRIVAGKRNMKTKTEMGEGHRRYIWNNHNSKQKADINLTRRFGQWCPEENALWRRTNNEDYKLSSRIHHIFALLFKPHQGTTNCMATEQGYQTLQLFPGLLDPRLMSSLLVFFHLSYLWAAGIRGESLTDLYNLLSDITLPTSHGHFSTEKSKLASVANFWEFYPHNFCAIINTSLWLSHEFCCTKLQIHEICRKICTKSKTSEMIVISFTRSMVSFEPLPKFN